MRKLKEIIRLRFDLDLSMEKIGRACKMSSSTVQEALSRFKRSGLSWPLPADMDEASLEKQLYRDEQRFQTPADSHQPNWPWVHCELRKGKNVTLMLVWEEYCEAHPEGYGYSWFCEGYAKFRDKLHPVMRQVHRMGERCFVDYAGPTFQVIDAVTGEVLRAVLFIGVLGGSSYTYAEATWSEELPNWLGSHVRMVEYFGGCPGLFVPDNLKSGVTKADYYEPDINPAYNDLAVHYKVAVLPARKCKPRDKAKAENGVLLAERWIMAKLRNRIFYSLDALNEAIRELLIRLNAKPFQKLDGSRQSLFEEHEKPRLRQLPAEPYEYAQWKKVTVNIDYHVELDHNYYSVPYQLIHEKVDARLTGTTVEILHKGQRVASHRRSYVKGQATTLTEHMPTRHSKMLEWTPEWLMIWAEKTGPATREMAEGIMASKEHPQQGYRACLGVLRLGEKYGAERLEAACRRAVSRHAFSFRSVQSILGTGLDKVPMPDVEAVRPPVDHENVRGAAYYAKLQQEEM